MAKYCIEKRGPALYNECNECEDRICEYFFCLVVGSRTFTDYEFMKEKLDFVLQNHAYVVIVSGGAEGADTLAERYATEKGFKKVIFPADWRHDGRRAGYVRNKRMHEYIANADYRGVVAFWDGKSRGTANNFELAKEYHNDLRIYRF